MSKAHLALPSDSSRGDLVRSKDGCRGPERVAAATRIVCKAGWLCRGLRRRIRRLEDLVDYVTLFFIIALAVRWALEKELCFDKSRGGSKLLGWGNLAFSIYAVGERYEVGDCTGYRRCCREGRVRARRSVIRHV
jgi:hypothetical protein